MWDLIQIARHVMLVNLLISWLQGSLLHALKQILGSQRRINRSAKTGHPFDGTDSSVTVIVREVECGHYPKLVSEIEETCRRHFLAYGTV
jgi:hypothetical protein